MDNTIKALLAKAWKDEVLDLEPGRHHFDETIIIRVMGTVERGGDQMVAPTATLPLIPIIALFWEKAGVTRDRALAILREAIAEAMAEKASKGERIEARIKDVEAAVQAVKEELIAKLPKVKRSGRTITKDLVIQILPAHEKTLTPVAA
jgi:acyl carrier protein phosphodiesterase